MIDKLQQKALLDVLKSAEEATDCRIHLVCQRAANGYVWTSLAFAAIAVLVATALISFTSLTSHSALALQFVVFGLIFCGMHFTDLKYRFTPDVLKQAFAHRSLGKVLREISASRQISQAQTANVLVMVSQIETYAKVIPSSAVAKQVPATVWSAINDSLLIDVGHGDFSKGMRNSTSAITKLLKVYFPVGNREGKFAAPNRLLIAE